MKDLILEGADVVQQLVREGVHEIHITPETPVLCIHRGRRHTEAGAPVHHEAAARHRDNSREAYFVGDYKDTYDGLHYIIAPGYFMAPYGAALHFQRRAVVPGSRNPDTGFQTSFISIIGVVEGNPGGGFKVLKAVDDQADWPPFTDEECGQYEVAFEAIDRDAMAAPIEREVTLQNVSERLAGAKPGTSRGKSGGKPSRVKSGRSAGGKRGRGPQIETTDDSVLQAPAPGENAAIREAAEGRSAGTD